jgi:hypothetical protein
MEVLYKSNVVHFAISIIFGPFVLGALMVCKIPLYANPILIYDAHAR